MSYQWLDMERFPRREHFAYFSSLAYPYVGVTVNVDISALLRKIRGEKLPFFLSVCYCVTRAANSVPELRQRIKDGGIMEFDQCVASHTVALEDGTFCYCQLENIPDLYEYIREGKRAQEAAKQQASIAEEPEEALRKFFISTLPWLSQTALVQPTPFPADSNPRITWGKYFYQEGKALLPVSIQCHHALVDGIHIAAFYQSLDREVAEVAG